MIAFVAVAAAATEEAPPLAHAAEAPRQRFYAKVEEVDGKASARWRRKSDGEFQVDELEDGTIVRVRRMAKRAVVEDRRYDASGRALVTVSYGADALPERAVIHSQPEATVELGTWTIHELPGGRIAAPSAPVDLPGGSVRLDVLEGELDVWFGPAADPMSEAFRQGIAAGCGCTIAERAVTWVDGRPGVRYRLLVPDTGPSEPVDLWAVPVPAGLWLATFRVAEASANLLAGRVLVALVDLDVEPVP